MEILFRNKLRTAKMCMKADGNMVQNLSDRDINLINMILNANSGYAWEPVEDGFAKRHKLPLIPGAA